MIKRTLINDILSSSLCKLHGAFSLFFFLLALSSFLSCKNETNVPLVPKKPTEAQGIVPDINTLKPAHIVRIDSCPSAVCIRVPLSTGGQGITNIKENKKAVFGPPEIKAAGFYAHMLTYSSEQGLYAFVPKVLCDSKGNIWFGTDGGGVIRYDGKSFSNYTTAQGLGANTVRTIAEDMHGNFWFGTDGGGVSVFNGKIFTHFGSVNSLGSNNIWAILEDRQGNMWFGTDGGGAVCYNGKFTSYTTAQGLAGNTVRCIAEDKSGNLWFGTNGGGVSKFDGHSFVTYTKETGLAGNDIRSIACDRKGNIWMGSYENGVSCYDGKSFTNFGTEQGLCGNSVNSICEDSSGKIWFGTNRKGVCSFDGRTFTTFSVTEGLCNNTVLSITPDKSGNVWFGTYGGGANCYGGNAFTTYTTTQGLPNNQVFSITEDHAGNKWFGTAVGGVCRYDGKTFTTFGSGQGLMSTQVVSITKDKDGNLWLGTYGGGMSRYDGKTMTTYTTAQGLCSNKIMALETDKNGVIWVATDGEGISRFDGHTFTNYTTAQGLCNNSVLCICEDKKGYLWFGTNGSGVSRWDGKTFTTFTSKQGLSDDKVYCIAEDKCGNIWLGTDGGGVSRYDGKSFVTYNTEQGLSNNMVFSIATDTTGNIWLGTNEGLCELSGYNKMIAQEERNKNLKVIVPATNRIANSEIIGDYTPVFKIYNFKRGYPVKDVNENAVYVDSKGIIWAGTGDKLVRFDPSSLNECLDTPRVFVSSIKIGNEPVCWSVIANKKNVNGKPAYFDSLAMVNEENNIFGNVLSAAKRDTMYNKFHDISFDSVTSFYPIPLNLVLTFRHNNISFDFGAIECSRPYMVNYQYMLVGYDDDWYPLTNKTSASFGNIHEGTYTFKLKAQSPEGIWSAPVSYTFKVLPPPYRTLPAYIIYILIAGLLIFGIIHLRTSQLRMDKMKLELVVAERTAQIGREKAEVEKQKHESDKLLLNILPEEVAAELKETGAAKAKYFDHVTVLFTDFVNFTKSSEDMTPQELIDELHNCFKKFDEIVTKYNIEKIKTIGDAYLAVSGLPQPDEKHAEHAVRAAVEIRDFMEQRYREIGVKTFRIRIGIHTGSVIAGIVGATKFAYDIWGDTVNTAARMEQNSTVGKINISDSTYSLVKNEFACTYRGDINAKNKGKMSMYFVD